MTVVRCVALLKGVNVGRAKRVAMADLRAMLGDLGYRDVVTHLQSGNAVFTTARPVGAVISAIEQGLSAELGVDARVIVRTHRQLVEAIAADPFAEIATGESRHLVGFFSATPEASRLTAFEEFVAARNPDPEVVGLHRISADHCYLWCPQGVHGSLFGAVDWDRKLGVTVTMRNFATARKLVELSG